MTGVRHPPARPRPSAASAAALGLLLVLAVVLVGLHVRDYSRISPIDELQHLDYLNRVVRDGEMVREGDLFQQEALRTEACQGLDAVYPIPRCGLRQYDPRDFQEGGFNSSYINPPIYYGASGAVASLLSSIAGSDSLFTTGRLSGALWLVIAVGLTWLAMKELGIAWQARVPALALVLTAPAVLHASATINPDSTAMMAGSAVLLTVLRWERRGRWWWPGLAAMAAVALKSTNLVGIGLGLLYVLIRFGQRWLQERAGEPRSSASSPALRSTVVVVLSMVVGLGIVAGGWLAVRAATSPDQPGLAPMEERFHVESIGLEELAGNAPAGLTPLQNPYVPKELRTQWIEPAARLVDRFLLVALGVAGITALRGGRVRALALATLLALLCVGPLFVLINYFVSDHSYVSIPSRYGLSAVPALTVLTGEVLTRPRARLLAGAAALLLVLATLRALAG